MEGGQEVGPTLYPIDGPWPGHLLISARPRGGDWLEDDVRWWRDSGIDVVVSLLTPEESIELEVEGEEKRSDEAGIVFVSFPIADREVPRSQAKALEVIDSLEAALAKRKKVAVHCRQGIGRSGLMAACLLVRAGVEPSAAFERVSAIRGCAVPETAQQREWVLQFAQETAPARATG
jgi:protein-tyrosine phosphatase